MTYTILFLSFIGALGIGLTYFGFATTRYTFSSTNVLSDLEERRKNDKNLIGQNFFTVARKGGLELAIQQADLDVTVSQFIRFNIIVFVVGFAMSLFLFQNLIISLGVGTIFIAGYFVWLVDRRDKKVMLFETAVADLGDRLSNQALARRNIHQSLTAMEREGIFPPIMQEDLTIVLANMNNQLPFDKCWKQMQEKRNSQSFDILINTLTTYQEKGSKKDDGLIKILEPLTDTIRNMTVARNQMDAKLTSVKFTSKFVALVPVFMAVYARQAMPDLSHAFQSPLSIICHIIAFSLALGGYWYNTKELKKINQLMEVERR